MASGVLLSMTTQYLASQVSPSLSPSSSSWSRLRTNSQLSDSLNTPSLSESLSQMSPMPSASASDCSGFFTPMQLSKVSETLSASTSTLHRVTSPGRV